MTKSELKKYVDTYNKNLIHLRNYENKSEEFNCIVSNYEYMLRLLLTNIFGEINSDLIEEYLFKQRQISFDTLWNKINGSNTSNRE